VSEDGGREGRRVTVISDVVTVNLSEHLVHPLLNLRSVGVVGAALFENQANELTATRNARPIDEFIGHILGICMLVPASN
jgi:hypothetical protein